ncbi:MAG: PIN domain-containing protein [Bryobacteraceae bacterium]|nr:PIN domain-containing protein [Bryobacteraceae bacterium]
MIGVVYDTAVLVAADGNERRAWAEHKVRLELGILPFVPAPVVAQASRSPRQVQLRRFLRGCTVVPFGEQEAHEAGRLMARAKTADVVDAAVAATAIREQATVLTGDTTDIERLLAASGAAIRVVAV